MPRVGVVGATGAVGRVVRRAARASAASRTCACSPRRARPGASSTAAWSRRRRPRRSPPATSTSASSRSAPRASRELVPHAVRGGAVCVDKSAAFRLQDGVPLVVPEVNGERALEHDGIVANPNCCAIPLTLVLKPLHDAAGLRAVRVATYQSASGKGAQRLQQLLDEPQAEHDLSHGLGLRRRGVRRGGQAARGDAQDPRAARAAGERDLRARAGAGRPRRVGVDRDRGAARPLARA